MSYESREGVDYLIDFYAVVGVEPEAEEPDLKRALVLRAKEYHPDRLEGLAPEFKEKGERMVQLLNRVREVLLDPEKRLIYDGILAEWKGPISKEGNPIISTSRYLEVSGKSPEEIEDMVADYVAKTTQMTGYNPGLLTFLEGLIENSDGEVAEDLRSQYEKALLQKDRMLALEEAERSQLLDMPDIADEGYITTLNYAGEIAERIAAARNVTLEQSRILAIGGVSSQLLLLSGEAPLESKATVAIDLPIIELPVYFEQQAAKVHEIAQERERIANKRIENLLLNYPEDALQVEFREDLLIGVEVDSEILWRSYKINRSEDSAVPVEVPEDITECLSRKNFKDVIDRGFGVITISLLENMDPGELIGRAIGNYSKKYPSNLLSPGFSRIN